MECHVVSPFWAEYDRWQRLRARGREGFLALEMARWQSLALLGHSVHTRESLWGNSRNPAMQFQGTYLVHEYLSILQSTITARRQKKEKEGNKAKGEVHLLASNMTWQVCTFTLQISIPIQLANENVNSCRSYVLFWSICLEDRGF